MVTARSALPSLAGTASHPATDGPVIVLTYAHGGGEPLTRALSGCPALACTEGSGLLPLCHTALAAWRHLEGREAPSPLALKSIRSLVAVMTITLQSGTGAARWCETARAGPAAAGSFLKIFPDTTFACVHRTLPAVIADAAGTYPWGLGGTPLWPFAAAHPGDTLAAITAYWAACTSGLLDFESAHPRACVRVRDEELIAEPQYLARILARLGLSATALPQPDQPGSEDDGGADAGPQPPLDQLPPHLLLRVSELHATLGYQPLNPSPAPDASGVIAMPLPA